MRFKVNALAPCVTYFSAGDAGRGAASLAMQASLFLWPTTYRLAREFSEARAVDHKLNELSLAYQVPARDGETGKRFQPGSNVNSIAHAA